MRTTLVCALALAVSQLGPVHSAEQEPLRGGFRERAHVWQVPVRLWVKDREGRYVKGLDEDDFYVRTGSGKIRPTSVDEYSPTLDDFPGVCVRVANDNSGSVISDLAGDDERILPIERTETGVLRLSEPYRQVFEDGQREIQRLVDSHPSVVNPQKSLISGGVFSVKSIFSPYVRATETGKIVDHLEPRLIREYQRIESLRAKVENAISRELRLIIRKELDEASAQWVKTALYYNMGGEARILADLTPQCRNREKALVFITDGIDTVLERYGDMDKGPDFIRALRGAYREKDYESLLTILAYKGIVPVPVYAIIRNVSADADTGRTMRIMEFQDAVVKSGGQVVPLGGGELSKIFAYVLERESNRYDLHFSYDSLEGARNIKPEAEDKSLAVTYSEPVIRKPDDSMLNSVFRNERDYSDEDRMVAAMAVSQGCRQGLEVDVSRSAVLGAIRRASSEIVREELQTARYALNLRDIRFGTRRMRRKAEKDMEEIPHRIADSFCPEGVDSRILAVENVLCSDES